MEKQIDDLQIYPNVLKPQQVYDDAHALIYTRYWLFFGLCLAYLVVTGFIHFQWQGFGALVLPSDTELVTTFSKVLLIQIAGTWMTFGIYAAMFTVSNGEQIKFRVIIGQLPKLLGIAIIAGLGLLPVFLKIVIYAIRAKFVLPEYMIQPEVDISVWSQYLDFFVSVAIQFFLFFAIPIIVDTNLGTFRAISLSNKAVMANFQGVVITMLLEFLIGIAGLLLFCIGFFFTMPMIFALRVVAYKIVFKKSKIVELLSFSIANDQNAG